MRISALAEFMRGSYADFLDRKTERQKELLNLRLYRFGKGEGSDGCGCFEYGL